MKFQLSKVSVRVFIIFVILTALCSSVATPASAQAEPALPVEQLLNADGTLDLSAGYTGNLDFTNFEVSLDPVLGPTFKPLATVNAWNALSATPLNTTVLAITIDGSDMYVGGFFTNAGGVPDADFIAKFSNGSWSALGSTPLTGSVRAIAISGSDVYAGGTFLDAGGVAEADKIAKFSGGSWSALGATPLNGTVHAIAISGSDVYVGGEFTDAGGVLQADAIAKFSGGVWSAVGGTNLSGTVFAIAINGSDLYAGGEFINAGGVAEADFIAKFSGGSWSALGTTPPFGFVYAIAISGSDVYAGGSFINAGGVAEADKIAKFSGGVWSALGATPLDNTVLTITINGSDVYAGGEFLNAGGDANADYIAKFNGGVWSALGATPLTERVQAIAISGLDVYAGGGFSNAGGVAEADYIARFETPPTSATFRSTSTLDGWILESTETSGVGGTKNSTATTFNLGDNASDRQYRTILSFNTTSLPDTAVITKVLFKIKESSVVGGGDPLSMFQGFMTDIKKGTFGTSALAIGDFQSAATKTLGPFSPTISSGWYTMNLTPGRNQINMTGSTQIRLRFQLDDNNNNVANYLKLYSGDAGSSIRPRLIIEYYVP